MSEKLSKNTFPKNHTKTDFKCFGPVAEKDGEFSGTMLADFGYFAQGEVDSNKGYHAAVVQSKIDSSWYVYTEFGRVGSTPTFQFTPAGSQQLAQKEYEKICHSKNDKRGVWINDPTLGNILQPKPGKDCYLVRPQAIRNTGLPDARTIATKEVKVTKKSKPTKKFHPSVESLLSDLNTGTIDYARTSMSTAAIPTLKAINEARVICGEAVKTSDPKELEKLTNILYSRIPKTKSRNVKITLSNDNIKNWLDDLDAFEDAIKNIDVKDVTLDLPFELEYLEPSSNMYKMVKDCFDHGTRNNHYYIKNIEIKNVWKIYRDDHTRIEQHINEIEQEKINISERPIYQPKRIDLNPSDETRYIKTNTALLFHGTRSVNVGGILRDNLRLPKQLVGVSINGAMFGPGSYFADDWKKSAGYTSMPGSYWSGGVGKINSRGAFMFLCDVVLGNPYVAPRAHGYNEPPKGFHSVLGKAGKSGVANNEFITYKSTTNNLKYLVEFF